MLRRAYAHGMDAPDRPGDSPRDPRWLFTRRQVLIGSVAAALAACADGDGGAPATSATPTTEATVPTPTTAQAAATTVPTSAAATVPTTAATVAPAFGDPFTLGVASGDPLADSVILWTRLLPADGVVEGDVEVAFEVATDRDMADVVSSGFATAAAALGHSVHVDATGLEPDTEYWYRFRVGEYVTPAARTRTFAATGTTPERFRFAFSSCQNWEQGYYAAYRDLVEQGDVDAFVFLGDYIYEYAAGGYADPRSRSTGQDFECTTVEQYRSRYALYRSDPLLQGAHALVPWIITWDDHEVDNDYAAAVGQDDDAVAAFLDRRAAAYQAWYEHMPVRLEPPSGPDYPIYRAFGHGDLVRFHVLDTRQYRSDQQRGEPFVASIGSSVQVRIDEVALSPDQTMLGNEQKAWLLGSVAESTAVWDVLAQQVFMFGAAAVPDAEPPVIVVDTWDGYARERTEVLEALAPMADNLVVLTGDFHSAAVGDVRADPFDRTRPVVATEFMAPSISSGFFDDNDEVTALVTAALAVNTQIRWFDPRRGYTLCEVTPSTWTAEYRAVADPFDAASAVDTASRWQITAGTPGAAQL